MKKLFTFLALVLGVVSCQTEPEGFDVNVGGEQDVNITVSLPEGTRADSALGAFQNIDMGQYDIRYIFQVFNAEGTVYKTKQVICSDDTTVSFPVRLIPNRTYNFVVWADLVKNGETENAHYTIGESLKEITLNEWAPMDESRDAYTGKTSALFNGDPITVTLTRPFSKVRVVTTDMAELMGVVPTEAKVVYTTEHYNTFNAFAQAPENKELNDKTHNKFSIVSYESVNSKTKTLFTDYFFATESQDVVKFTLEVFEENDAPIIKRAFNTDIPVKRNYVTTIQGDILTMGDNITVTVEDAFENDSAWNPSTDDYDVELWDGVTIEEPAYDAATKTYSIRNGNHLAWVAAAVNGTLPADTRATIEPKSFKGETIKLVKDINLNFENWTPIGIPTGYNNLFNGTFDGDGHKVANLRVDNNKGAGLFGATTSATIKNVVIDNVRLNTNHYAGAVVAWAESGAVAVKLENCVVKNAEVTVKAELVNGEWDNGDKGAALIGFAHAVNIAGCKVENVKVTAYRDFAGLVGYADKTSIVDCETVDVELEQDLTHNYKDETPDTYGEVIGRNGGGNKIDGEDFVATAQQLQAAVNAATGETTLCLGNDIVGDVTVVQKPGVKITINGRGFNYNGSIKVHSNSEHYADAAVTIKNVNFETSKAGVNFIEALENGAERYSTNITVENCTFTATGEAVNTAVGVQIKASKNAKVLNCTATDMHSLIQAQSCDETVVVRGCTINGKNGVAFKQVKAATVENTTIVAQEYGIRYDGNVDNYGIVVNGCDVTAYQPLIVRKMTGANNTIALEGENTLTTEEAYQIVITNGSDDEEYVKPTGTYALTGADNFSVYPRPIIAKVGNTEYDDIDEAIAAWTNGATLTLLRDVTLNDVITIKSTEHHILNLGTFTMTAASGKNAIEITCNARSSASYALTVNADATNPGGITAKGKACIYYKKSGSEKDRPIILINNGVFTGSYSINSISNGNTNCPQIWINGGVFNSYMNLTKNMLKVSGGTFHAAINCTGDSSAYRQISGGRFKSWQFMTADASNKFWVGTAKETYNVGVYVDDEGYLVVGGPVITEFDDRFEAMSMNYSKWSSYLKYSSAAQYGLYYTSAEKAGTSSDVVLNPNKQ